MKKRLILIISLALVLAFLLAACNESNNIETDLSTGAPAEQTEQSEQTTQAAETTESVETTQLEETTQAVETETTQAVETTQVEETTQIVETTQVEETTQTEQPTETSASEASTSESNTETEDTEEATTTTTEDNLDMEKWYIKEDSVQTVFEYGEKFNYRGIKAVHEVNGEITEYPENDLYVENEPVLTFPGVYEVSVEILSEEVIVTYSITVKDINVEQKLSASPKVEVSAGGSYKCEVEDLDLSTLQSKGKLLVDDSFASGGKFLQNYGVIGNCFGFTVVSDSEITGVNLVLRMANFAVTMIYPAEDIAVYQNYVSFDENTRLKIDPDFYLTTRAPFIEGEEGADTSIKWCEVVIENVTLSEGENTFMFSVIGKSAPFFDCVEIIVP